MTPEYDILIFLCERREHLMQKTWASFAPFLNPAARRVLVADGIVSPDIVSMLDPALLVQNRRRSGYVNSIISALALTNAEYFFWLEDDWEVGHQPIDVVGASILLQQHPDWIQVRWSKNAPLPSADRVLAPGLKESCVGFSANPCICRTNFVREGFEFLKSSPTGKNLGVDGFENVLTRWAADKRLMCAVVDPGMAPAVQHLGYLESTGRQWHMTASVEGKPAEHLLAFSNRPSFPRRCWMMIKLITNAAILSVRQLVDDGAYELAFRFVTVAARPKRKKYRGRHA